MRPGLDTDAYRDDNCSDAGQNRIELGYTLLKQLTKESEPGDLKKQ